MDFTFTQRLPVAREPLFQFHEDPENLRVSFIGDVDDTIEALAIHPTTFVLYGLDLFGTLYTVDKSTGALTLIGSASLFFAHGLAFAADGTLWACNTFGAGTSGLHVIDPETGQATFVGDIDRDFVVSLDFGPDGLLYGSDNGTDSLITINLQTAAATTVGPYGTPFGHNAIAWAPEPDPSEDLVCPADIDSDNMVGITDFLMVLGSWGGPGGDTNGDGTTDILDFLAVLGGWGPCS